jgi:hypothetical protein
MSNAEVWNVKGIQLQTIVFGAGLGLTLYYSKRRNIDIFPSETKARYIVFAALALFSWTLNCLSTSECRNTSWLWAIAPLIQLALLYTKGMN